MTGPHGERVGFTPLPGEAEIWELRRGTTLTETSSSRNQSEMGKVLTSPPGANLRDSLDCDCFFFQRERKRIMKITRKTRLLIAVVLTFGVASCDNPGPSKPDKTDVAGVKQALAGVEAGWNEAFLAKNLDAIVEPYTNDAVFVLPGLSAQVGTSAIRNTYVEALKDPNFGLTLTSDKVEVAQSGDMALSQGHFTMKGTDPKTKQPTTIMTGPYLTVFRKQADGSWKAIQDWVSANPPSAPGP